MKERRKKRKIALPLILPGKMRGGGRRKKQRGVDGVSTSSSSSPSSSAPSSPSSQGRARSTAAQMIFRTWAVRAVVRSATASAAAAAPSASAGTRGYSSSTAFVPSAFTIQSCSRSTSPLISTRMPYVAGGRKLSHQRPTYIRSRGISFATMATARPAAATPDDGDNDEYQQMMAPPKAPPPRKRRSPPKSKRVAAPEQVSAKADEPASESTTQSEGQILSDDNASAAKDKDSRRLAEYDDLFFDESGGGGSSAQSNSPATTGQAASGNNNQRGAASSSATFPPRNARPSQVSQNGAKAQSASLSNPNSITSNPEPRLQPQQSSGSMGSGRSFPQQKSTAVRAASSAASATAAKATAPQSPGYFQPGQKNTAAAAAAGRRSIPPPMEFDYDYYDAEMGVSGSVGLLDGERSFEAGGNGLMTEEPYDPMEVGESAGMQQVSSNTSRGAQADHVTLKEQEASDDDSKELSPAAKKRVGSIEEMIEAGEIEDTATTESAKPLQSNTAPMDAFAEILDTSALPTGTPEPSPAVADFMSETSNGNGRMTQIDIFASKAESIQKSIYAQNGGKEFNINSPKQVAKALYGDDADNQSTNKDVLDAMAAAGNRLADLILQYRQAQRDLKRAKKQAENKENGIHVEDFHKSAPGPVRTAAPTSAGRSKTSEENFGQLEFDDENNSDPLLLVDASAYIFRAYYSMPPLHRSDGTPVGAVLGFCNMLNRLVLNRLLAGAQPRIVLVFDAKGPTFRHDLYPEYKANRSPCPVDLVPQFDIIRDAAKAYGIDQIEAPSYEADDVIATLATMAKGEGINVHVLSGDKDLMQLVTPPDEHPSVNMIDPKEMIRVTHDVVVNKWGVSPELLGDVLALAGDSADNIPGCPGIGPKIARDLINEYGSLERLLEMADGIKQKARRTKLMENSDKVLLSRKLVTLDVSVPLESMTMPDHYTSISELKMAPLDSEQLLAFYGENGLQDLARRLRNRIEMNGSKTNEEGQGSSNAGFFDKEPVANMARNNADLNESIRRGLLIHSSRRREPPKPDDFQDVPF